jgi:transglutaminase-like putative cysteine protease
MKSAKKPISKVESSVGVRVPSLAMAILSISLACHYVQAPVVLCFVYVFTTLLGSFCAYYFRKQDNKWLTWLAVIGTFAVMVNFAQEIFFQFYVGKLNPIGPFVTVLSGLLALHTLDLKTRLDINISALIAVGLIACTATVAQDIVFGSGVLLFILLAAIMLYFECVSSSLHGLSKLSREQAFNLLPHDNIGRSRTMGSTVLAVTSLPVLSLIVFAAIPRIDSLIDRCVVDLVANGFPFRVTLAPPGGSSVNSQEDGTRSSETGDSIHAANDSWPSGSSGGNGIGSGGGASGNGSGTLAGSSSQLKASSGAGGPGQLPFSFGMGNAVRANQAHKDELSDFDRSNFTRAETIQEEELAISYGSKSSAASDQTVLFTCSSSREVFLKRLCYNYFDGQNWKIQDEGLVASVDLNPDALTNLSRVPSLHRSPCGAVDVAQEITAKTDLGHIIPAASVPQQLQFPTDRLFVDRYGSLRLPASIHIGPGTKYQVVSSIPIFNLSALRSSSLSPAEAQQIRHQFQKDLQIPPNLGDEVGYLANAIVGRQTNWFSQAESICSYLRENCQYSLDVQPADRSGNKNGNLVREFLLVTKKGDCSHFASSFVMLCRSLGIPSRCVGGFAPGTRNLITGLTEVRTIQSHAWAEIYVPKFGWVPFDSVPDGYLPAPPPDRGIIAALGNSPIAHSLSKMIDAVAKAKGLHKPQEESVDNLAKMKSATGGNAAGNKPVASKSTGLSGASAISGLTAATGSTGAKDANASGTAVDSEGSARSPKGAGPDAGSSSSPALTIIQSQSAAESTARPLMTVELPSPSRTGTKGGNTSNNAAFSAPFFRSLDWSHVLPKGRGWLAILIWLGGIILTISLIGPTASAIRHFQGRFAGTPAWDQKPSTLLFLKVVRDLARLKVMRETGDTPQDIIAKVSKRLAQLQQPRLNELLPDLLQGFMDLYCLNRFTEGESLANTTKLQDIQQEIHALLTTAQ